MDPTASIPSDGVRIPGSHDKVFNGECLFSHDTPVGKCVNENVFRSNSLFNDAISDSFPSSAMPLRTFASD